MLIKFTGGGRGGGRQVAEYLTRSEGRDHAPPEVVRGDMMSIGIQTGPPIGAQK